MGKLCHRFPKAFLIAVIVVLRLRMPLETDEKVFMDAKRIKCTQIDFDRLKNTFSQYTVEITAKRNTNTITKSSPCHPAKHSSYSKRGIIMFEYIPALSVEEPIMSAESSGEGMARIRLLNNLLRPNGKR